MLTITTWKCLRIEALKRHTFPFKGTKQPCALKKKKKYPIKLYNGHPTGNLHYPWCSTLDRHPGNLILTYRSRSKQNCNLLNLVNNKKSSEMKGYDWSRRWALEKQLGINSNKQIQRSYMNTQLHTVLIVLMGC